MSVQVERGRERERDGNLGQAGAHHNLSRCPLFAKKMQFLKNFAHTWKFIAKKRYLMQI